MKNEEFIGKTDGKVYKLPCRICDVKTNHVALKSIENLWSEDRDEIRGRDRFEIVKCQGCDQISFRSTSSHSEDFFIDNETGELIYPDNEQLYPSRMEGRKHLNDVHYLPFEIRSVYSETHGALCSRLKILAGTGIRAIIESICNEENAQGSTLEKKIDDLSVKSILTKQEAETLHRTRILGNRTVHEIIAPTDEELDVAMDIVENLIKTVYIIPKKAQKLKK